MNLKTAAAVALISGSLATGGLAVLQAHTPDDVREQVNQQQLDNGAESEQQQRERVVRSGQDLGDSTYRDQLRPREVRPRGRLPRLPVRLP